MLNYDLKLKELQLLSMIKSDTTVAIEEARYRQEEEEHKLFKSNISTLAEKKGIPLKEKKQCFHLDMFFNPSNQSTLPSSNEIEHNRHNLNSFVHAIEYIQYLIMNRKLDCSYNIREVFFHYLYKRSASQMLEVFLLISNDFNYCIAHPNKTYQLINSINHHLTIDLRYNEEFLERRQYTNAFYPEFIDVAVVRYDLSCAKLKYEIKRVKSDEDFGSFKASDVLVYTEGTKKRLAKKHVYPW